MFMSTCRLLVRKVGGRGSCHLHMSPSAMAQTSVRSMRNDKSSSSFTDRGYILLIIPAATLCLGTWQVRRRKWKLDLIQELEERTQAQPVPLLDNLDQLQELEYKRVTVRGRFDHSHELHVGPRAPVGRDEVGSLMGGGGKMSAGAHVITAFEPTNMNGQRIMVNRGWVSRDHVDPKRRPLGQVTDEVELVGVVRHSEKRQPFMSKNDPQLSQWFSRDLDTMSQALNTQPIFLDADANSTIKGGPIGGQTRVTLRNEHLSYIVTWYSLSAITLAMWYKMYWRK